MFTSQPPVSKHVIVQNIFIKIMTFVHAGDSNQGHKHTYDHMTLLSAGELEIYCDGQTGRVSAPHLFLTPKGKVHRFRALTDHTVVACIHPLRAADTPEILSRNVDLLEAVKCVDHLIEPTSAEPCHGTVTALLERNAGIHHHGS